AGGVEAIKAAREQMAEQLRAYIKFENSMAEAGATVLKTLSVEGYEKQGEFVRRHLSGMGSRRTLRLVSAAYTDLTSTGNLQLIRSRGLRDQLLRYFAEVARAELIIEKNNTVFIDNMYFDFVVESGITWEPGNWQNLDATLSEGARRYYEIVGPDIVYPVDSIITEPAESKLWDDIRRMCILRVRVSSIGLSLAAELVDESRKLKIAIDQELIKLSR
ncbi:MAG: hypothetical protein JJ992_11185, partial [Planctomycetes bacterium]|nr:hypothetical protein [Planctomycetota bacterium]